MRLDVSRKYPPALDSSNSLSPVAAACSSGVARNQGEVRWVTGDGAGQRTATNAAKGHKRQQKTYSLSGKPGPARNGFEQPEYPVKNSAMRERSGNMAKQVNPYSMAIFERFPKQLREGPWSPMAYVALLLLSSILVMFAQEAFRTFPLDTDDETHPAGRWLSAVAFAYMGYILLYMYRNIGLWPLASFTMMSWVLLTLRHFCRVVGLRVIGEILRFPAVTGAVITFTIWWGVLVPVIMYFLVSPDGRREFWYLSATCLSFSSFHPPHARPVLAGDSTHRSS